jgi:hypothetical protein
MDDNHETELPVESEELPPLGPGQLGISREIAGKRVTFTLGRRLFNAGLR